MEPRSFRLRTQWEVERWSAGREKKAEPCLACGLRLHLTCGKLWFLHDPASAPLQCHAAHSCKDAARVIAKTAQCLLHRVLFGVNSLSISASA